jgi:hypothetical protein
MHYITIRLNFIDFPSKSVYELQGYDLEIRVLSKYNDFAREQWVILENIDSIWAILTKSS